MAGYLFSHGWECWKTVQQMTKAYGNSSDLLETGLQIGAVLWLVAVAPAAFVLLVVADTGLGRAFAVLSVFSAALPLLAIVAWATKARMWKIAAGSVTTVIVILAVVVVKNAPTGANSVGSCVTHQYFGHSSEFRHYAFSNLVPEGDQLLFGFTLMPLLDPLFTTSQSGELKRMTTALYRELEQDSDFRELGSNMGTVYDDLLGTSESQGDAFVYVPAGVDRTKPLPVLVFFHGSGGNFKVYTWILSKLADRLGFLLVAPSSGIGNWCDTESVAALDAAVAMANRVAAIDGDNVHLIGLSNGGRAVSQLAGMAGRRFRSLIFVSPVFDADRVNPATLRAQGCWAPILVINGGRDDRVPVSYVEENVSLLVKTGAQVEHQTMADAGHFLMFSHRQMLIEELEKWLARRRQAK